MADLPTDFVHFPTGSWTGRTAVFEPGPAPPPGEVARAVIVFARGDCGYVLADIQGRGWTVPSGRLEPGETAEQAAVRETMEEIGANIAPPTRIGRYVLTDRRGRRLEFPTYISPVGVYGAIPPGSESRGARCFALADIPRVYWFWDDLLAAVFRYADACLDAFQPDGCDA